MFLVGHLVFENIKNLKPDGIGGLTFGADPMAMATAFVSELKGMLINAFSIRKTQKDHGIIRWVEGDMNPGQRVVIIDDVATTGGSTIKAIERAGSEGLEAFAASERAAARKPLSGGPFKSFLAALHRLQEARVRSFVLGNGWCLPWPTPP